MFYSLRRQEEEGTLETSSSTSLISEMGGKLTKGKGLAQGHIARGKEDQSFSMYVRTYILYFTIVTESTMSISQESRKLWG